MIFQFFRGNSVGICNVRSKCNTLSINIFKNNNNHYHKSFLHQRRDHFFIFSSKNHSLVAREGIDGR